MSANHPQIMSKLRHEIATKSEKGPVRPLIKRVPKIVWWTVWSAAVLAVTYWLAGGFNAFFLLMDAVIIVIVPNVYYAAKSPKHTYRNQFDGDDYSRDAATPYEPATYGECGSSGSGE